MAANLSPANEARLRAAIGERGLQDAEELIVASSVECAMLCTLGPDDYSQVGTSRYGGVPDLPDETWWPQTANGTFYQFLMQINLAATPDFVGNVLPRCGMLYAFLVEHNENDKDWTIVWADAALSELRRMEAKPMEQFADWYEGNDLPPYIEGELKPHQISVHAVIDVPEGYTASYSAIANVVGLDRFHQYNNLVFTMGSAICQDDAGKLLGWPSYICHDPTEDGVVGAPTADDVLLWTLKSDTDVEVTFENFGYVQFFINRDALAACEFSQIKAWIEST